MKTRILLTAALFALVHAPSWARVAVVGDFVSRIEAAVGRGELGPEQVELYWLYAIKAPERLPGEYQMAAPLARRAGRELEPEAPLTLRCGTSVLRRVQGRLPQMPPAMREEAEALLRPSYVRQPSRAGRSAGKTAAHLLTSWVETENFSIEWGPEITDENGSIAVDEDGDGVPDVVQRWADLFEKSYAEVVQEMGFTDQILEQRLVPVYIGNSDPEAAIDDIGFGVYGFTAGFPGELPY
ncbi:MAG: hypothetical protein IH608_11160, partial [Proteobacteria bacterium]|nr:hypothetical protein [Pseudomonadota bacterium]